MARALHAETDPESIKNDLKRMNLKILNVVNILGYRYSTDEDGKRKRTSNDKMPLRLFELAFDKNEDVGNIYALNVLCNQKVSIKPVRRNYQKIVQCKAYQGYNHVKSNCYETARCVKCAGYHYTKDCTKDRSTEPKCVNCGQGHTANYRGCMVAVELQRLQDKARKGKQREINSQKKSIKELQAAQQSRQAEKSTSKTKPTTANVSYANKAAKGTIHEDMTQLE